MLFKQTQKLYSPYNYQYMYNILNIHSIITYIQYANSYTITIYN